jgi:hypothetical protein
MIAAVCSAPCALQHRTESGLQARPLFFQYVNFLDLMPRNQVAARLSG